MVKKSEIGKLINQKLTGKEIRKQIKDFPENPDLAYFESLGYTAGTAKAYLSRFRKNEKTNSSNRSQSTKETPKSTIDLKQPKIRKTKQNDLDVGIFRTKKANSNNIIIDTCSVVYDPFLDIISKAQKVTVIYTVINELDSLNKNNDSTLLGAKVRDIITKLLEDNSGKYRLVPYGYRDERKADDVIIDYLMTLPVDERPTLLSSDKDLCLKTKCLGLEYIFYKIPKNLKNAQEDAQVKTNSRVEEKKLFEPESKETLIAEEKETIEKQQNVEDSKTENDIEENVGPQNNHLGIDVKISWQVVEFKRLYGDAEIFAMYENECMDVSHKEKIQTPDSIIIAKKAKNNVNIHYMMLGNKDGIQVKKYTYKYINELYASDLSTEVIEHIKNMF